MVERVGGPGAVGEPFVARRGCDLAAADPHLDQPADYLEPVRGDDSGLDHGPLQEPSEGGGDLAAGEADKGVGAQDGRIVAAEGVRC